jgi:hypothetical protein
MMKELPLTLIPLVLASLITSGCQTVPVVPHAVNCDASPELLARKCATPGQIANTTTYAALVDTMQADRKALQECNVTADALRETLQRCNQATAEYNKKIDALNSSR